MGNVVMEISDFLLRTCNSSLKWKVAFAILRPMFSAFKSTVRARIATMSHQAQVRHGKGAASLR